jgi:VanZ family protein
MLVIAYASLQPFRGWRMPPPEVLGFLLAPWPRYITLEDLLINVAAYMPLGLLLAVALRHRLSMRWAVLTASLLCFLLSLAMESVQMFLPSRISSNVDLLTNATGGLFGAMAAPLLLPAGLPGRWIAAWRERLFAPDTVSDAGLVVVCLWLVTHLHPVAQLFGTGNLRATLALPSHFLYTPQLQLAVEAAIVFFNLTGLGLLVSLITRDARRAPRLIASVVIAGMAVKTLAGVILFSSPGPLVWLTPGVAAGLLLGAVLLYPLILLPRLARTAVAAFCFGAALVAINLAPENPYQTIPSALVPGGATHLLRFSNIVRALSELWPLLAIGHLAAAAVASVRTRRNRL